MHILIVDGSFYNRYALQNILREAGYTDVTLVSSPSQAFSLLGLDRPQEKKIDLILMEIIMLEMDGIQACSRIKSYPQLKDIPVIMMTPEKDVVMLEAAFKAGAMDYIVTPVQKVELLARIRSALALKQEMDRRKAWEQELLALAAQLEAANELLRKQSSLDGLTGIANRRHFDECCEVEWKRAQREGKPLSLIMADIDVFKLYNDNYGHLAGDECLKKIALQLQRNAKRPGDLAARYGGEEFIIILPKTNLQGALAVAREIHTAVNGLAIPHAYSPVSNNVTVSLGVATAVPARGNCHQELIKAADQALYRAKQNGRNQIQAATHIVEQCEPESVL